MRLQNIEYRSHTLTIGVGTHLQVLQSYIETPLHSTNTRLRGEDICPGVTLVQRYLIDNLIHHYRPLLQATLGRTNRLAALGKVKDRRRSLDYAVALEGSLKLKEISYIHAEAYAAGELKHGTLALIVEGIPVIALATQEDIYDKTVNNIKEIKARDAVVIGIALEGDKNIAKYVDHTIFVPRTNSLLAPLLAVIPLQLLAYYAAITRGCDVDKPRNLAKSVTVE